MEKFGVEDWGTGKIFFAWVGTVGSITFRVTIIIAKYNEFPGRLRSYTTPEESILDHRKIAYMQNVRGKPDLKINILLAKP